MFVAAGGCLGAALAFVGSCIRPDPNHCHHNNGDAFCGGSTPYCNRCLSSLDNQGCVDEEPEGDCYSPGDDPFVETTTGSTGGDDPTDDGMVTTTTGPTDCTAEGERDEACPGDAPFCLDGVCAGCEGMGGDDYCAELDSSLPVCATLGDCVECSDANTDRCVGDTPFCDPVGSCSGCYEHSQCGDYGCDLFTGRCMNMNGGVINWVEGSQCTEETGFGTEDQPYCNLGSVQGNIDSGSSIMTIRFKSPHTYTQSVSVSSGEVVAVIGDNVAPRIGNASALQVVNGGRLYAQNVRLQGDTGTTVCCNTSGEVWIRDARVTSNEGGSGMQIDPQCNAVIERSIIALNAGGGIIVNSADVKIYSSAVMSNGDSDSDGDQATYGISLLGGTFEASHLTLIANRGSTNGRNINCDVDTPTEVSIRNSIIMHPQGLSFEGCNELDTFELVNSAVDEDAYEDAENGVENITYKASFFESSDDDPHLRAGTPFNDVARWQDGDPRTDLDGEDFSTTPGAGNFAGCDERQ